MLCLTPPQGQVLQLCAIFSYFPHIKSFKTWSCVYVIFCWITGPDWKARIEHLMAITPLSYALVILHKDKVSFMSSQWKSSQFHWKIRRFTEFAMFSAIVRWVSPLYSRQEQCRANMMVNSFNFKLNYSSTCFIIAAETDQVVGPIDGWAISSESCAFLPIGAHLRREVLPGEIVELSKNGLRSIGRVNPPANKKLAFCIFEYVYFARADSYFEGNGHSLHKFA